MDKVICFLSTCLSCPVRMSFLSFMSCPHVLPVLHVLSARPSCPHWNSGSNGLCLIHTQREITEGWKPRWPRRILRYLGKKSYDIGCISEKSYDLRNHSMLWFLRSYEKSARNHHCELGLICCIMLYDAVRCCTILSRFFVTFITCCAVHLG